MPIRPENKARYPKNWKEIRNHILLRAGNRCEWCGVFNHEWGYYDFRGKFRWVKKSPLKDAGHQRPPFKLACDDGRIIKIIEIVLTIAHMDHTPENCADDNLKALCQRCHNGYDAKTRHAHRRERISIENGQCLLYR